MVTLFGYFIYFPSEEMVILQFCCAEESVVYHTLCNLDFQQYTKLLTLRISNDIVKFQGQENTKKTETVNVVGRSAGLRIPISGVTAYGTIT